MNKTGVNNQMNQVANQIAISHFGKRKVNSLAKKGIFFLGLTVIPNMNSSMPYATGETGYEINDNGCSKLKTFLEILEIAK